MSNPDDSAADDGPTQLEAGGRRSAATGSRSLEDQAVEYAEALNDIAEMLHLPSNSTAAEIVAGVGRRWADGSVQRRELLEAWHLLNVLQANMRDDGPTWPRVLEWLDRNEAFRPEDAALSGGDRGRQHENTNED